MWISTYICAEQYTSSVWVLLSFFMVFLSLLCTFPSVIFPVLRYARISCTVEINFLYLIFFFSYKYCEAHFWWKLCEQEDTIPITVAAGSKTRTIFAYLNTVIAGLNHSRDMDVAFLCLCCPVYEAALAWTDDPFKESCWLNKIHNFRINSEWEHTRAPNSLR